MEVASDPTKPGVEALLHARRHDLLTVVDEGDSEAFPSLDSGESTVVSAAAAANAMALLDERKARVLAATDPYLVGSIQHVTGILGLILLSKRRGLVPALQPLLDELISQKFWVSSSLYDDILREAGER